MIGIDAIGRRDDGTYNGAMNGAKKGRLEVETVGRTVMGRDVRTA